MVVRVCFTGQAFELKPDRGYFQPPGKGTDNAVLLFRRPEHKVDRLNLQNTDKPIVRRFDNAAPEYP